MKKVYVHLGGQAYERMFLRNGWEVVDSVEEADVVQLCGGADVEPVLYGEPAHPKTFFNVGRDMSDGLIYHISQEEGKPIAGICRGGQFLNVMNGGRMIQHVADHAIGGTHEAIDWRTRETIQVSSTHHQMMEAGEGGEIIATAAICTKKEWMREVDGEPVMEWNTGDGEDVEVVWYKDTRSLCFQPHPEFFDPEHECQAYYFKLLEEFL